MKPIALDSKLALISVSEKHGLLEFGRELVALGWTLVSTGGTAKYLIAGGIEVHEVTELTKFPEMMGGRLKTLHPMVHGGLLGRPEDKDVMEQQGIQRIELVCVNLYPLAAEIAKPNATREDVIEKTDIGGPTMLSSAAKGRKIVVCDPADYTRVINWLKAGKPDESILLTELCAKADGLVAGYRLASARYHSGGAIDGMVGTRVSSCKYGENAWQTPAGLYSTGSKDPLALDKFELVQGVPPSYINWCDVDRMLQTMTHIAAVYGLNTPCIAIGVKHGNPCGAAATRHWDSRNSGNDRSQVLRKMVSGDTRAIFGGFVMVNFRLDEELAEVLLTHAMPTGQRRLLDGIVASEFTGEAIAMLKRKGDKCRLIANPALLNLNRDSLNKTHRIRPVRGGFLVQPNYTNILREENLECYPTPEIGCSWGTRNEGHDVRLAWAIGATSNSNTITLVKDGMLIGNGVGQQDRVGAAKLALQRACDAGHDVHGAVAYSDSFFPFPDGPTVLAEAGIKVIMASSGSVKDKEVQAACAKLGVTLLMIPDSEGRGFFGH